MADDNTQRFDILLTGAAQPGVEAALVAARLAELFRIPPERAALLLQGKAQRVKAGVDRATALRYRDALQRTGALFAIRAAAGTEAAAATTPATPAAAVPVAAPLATTPSAPASSTATSSTAAPIATASPPAGSTAATLTLAEPGTPVLTAAERAAVPVIEIGASALSLAPPFTAVVAATPQPQPPNTSHLSLRAEGELLDAGERRPPAVPVTPPAYSLAEPGAQLETLATATAPLALSTDHLDLAPPGAPLLDDDERRPAPPAPPPGESVAWGLAPVKASFDSAPSAIPGR